MAYLENIFTYSWRKEPKQNMWPRCSSHMDVDPEWKYGIVHTSKGDKKMFVMLKSLDCRLSKKKRFWPLVWTFPKRMWQQHPWLTNIYPEVLPLEWNEMKWNEMKWNEMKYIQRTSNTFVVALKVRKTSQKFCFAFFPDQTDTLPNS